MRRGQQAAYTGRLRARTLVTGATGFIGSHVARLLVERGDEVRATVRRGSTARRSTGSDVATVRADILDRRAVRRAMRGIERVFHVAGTTSFALPRERRSRSTSRGPDRARGGAARRGRAGRLHLVGGGDRPGAAGRHRRRDERLGRRPLRDPVRRLQARGRGGGAAAGRARAAARDRQPRARDGAPRRPGALLDGARAALHAPADPRLRRRHAQHRRRRGRRARASARRRARHAVGERYILGNRNFTLDRLFADLGRLSGVEPPAIRLPLPVALALAEAARAPAAARCRRRPRSAPRR